VQYQQQQNPLPCLKSVFWVQQSSWGNARMASADDLQYTTLQADKEAGKEADKGALYVSDAEV